MEQNDWHAIVAKPSRKEPMAAAVAELLQRDPSLDAVMDMALGQGAEAFRASRCVAWVYEWDRALFAPYKRRFVSDFDRVAHPGVRRIYGSLMHHLLERGEYRPDREAAEHLAEVVCSWSIEPGVKVSTLVWTLSVLGLLARQVEWADDMIAQLVALNDLDRSPGMRALLRRVRTNHLK